MANHRELYRQFTKLLLEARKGKGVTQVELSEMLDKPQSYVSKYETGERRLDVVEMIIICRKLNISPTTVVKKLIKSIS